MVCELYGMWIMVCVILKAYKSYKYFNNFLLELMCLELIGSKFSVIISQNIIRGKAYNESKIRNQWC